MKTEVLAIGELLADIISSDYVERLSEVKGFEMHAGGSPANVCANLKWLGINSALISCVGQDTIGDFLIDKIRSSGLSTDQIHRSKQFPTSIVIVGRSRGTPDFIAYRSADAHLPEIDKNLINQTGIVHTCAFALSRNPSQHHILDALSHAVSQHKHISVDWNYAPSLWESDGTLVFQKLCSMHPLLKVSMDDVSRFLQRSVSMEEARSFLEKTGASVVCLTCGKDGVWFREKENDWQFAPAENVEEVKDTTGAGDAFWAGFLSAFVRDEPVEACVSKGVHVAAKKIQKFGPLYS
jgi:sugar/nucleoside kinase (ribokinase family)